MSAKGRIVALAVTVGLSIASHNAFAAGLAPHPDVRGTEIASADVRAEGAAWRAVGWGTLSSARLEPGRYELRFHVVIEGDAEGVRVPVCAGLSSIRVDSRPAPRDSGPVVLPLGVGAHDVVLGLDVSRYERRIACGEPPRVGTVVRTAEGIGVLSFESPYASRGGGRAVVYVPPGHDPTRPAPLLVGTHPWNGSMWTYVAYDGLLHEARTRDVVLVMPSGLGNSLYTADAEDEVLRAVDAVKSALAIDARRTSIWGASMGGAGATTIGFHHPDRFADVTSFFGDSRYDLSTYVRAILPDARAAHRVDALDVVENARHLHVHLIHGEDDATSPIRQSEMLADAMTQLGFDVRFDRVPGMGHAGGLVARFLPQLVAEAAGALVPEHPDRVTFRSVRTSDVEAYGVHLERSSVAGDAFVDIERLGDTVRVHHAEGVRAITLSRGALGTSPEHPLPVVVDDPHAAITVGWELAP